MAFKMTKAELTSVEAVKKLIEADYATLELSIDALECARQEAAAQLATLEGHRTELFDVLEAVIDRAQGEFNDKSDKWQEGEKAAAATAWIETLTQAKDALEDEVEIELSLDDSVAMPEIEPDLDEIPTEAEE